MHVKKFKENMCNLSFFFFKLPFLLDLKCLKIKKTLPSNSEED